LFHSNGAIRAKGHQFFTAIEAYVVSSSGAILLHVSRHYMYLLATAAGKKYNAKRFDNTKDQHIRCVRMPFSCYAYL
jgi:hypothetical protein